MSSFCGATTHDKPFAGLRRYSTRVFFAALFAAALAIALPTQAQQRTPLTLMEAEDRALDQEPGQAAFEARAEALEEQSVAVGQLPDPKLRMGLANFPVESGGLATEGMTQAQLGIRQSFPPGKSRAVSTRQFQSLANEMAENADARGRDVLTSARTAWLETYYWQQAHTIVSESRPLFSDLVTVTRSLYAVGSKDQQDVLRAELELSRLDDRLIDINKQHARARAALSEWVGGEASRPIAEKLPSWERVPALETLRTDLLAHPVLKAADALVDARGAGIDLAKERYKPGWTLDLGYGYRDGSLPSAGVTLVRGDLLGVARARLLSQATMRNIRQNLFFAFAYNTAGIPLAAGVLYPFFGLLLSPMIAAAAMSLSSVLVIGNALRLRHLQL